MTRDAASVDRSAFFRNLAHFLRLGRSPREAFVMSRSLWRKR